MNVPDRSGSSLIRTDHKTIPGSVQPIPQVTLRIIDSVPEGPEARRRLRGDRPRAALRRVSLLVGDVEPDLLPAHLQGNDLLDDAAPAQLEPELRLRP